MPEPDIDPLKVLDEVGPMLAREPVVPPDLAIDTDDVLISPSSMQDITRCHRKNLLRRVCRIKPSFVSSALDTGRLVHDAVAMTLDAVQSGTPFAEAVGPAHEWLRDQFRELERTKLDFGPKDWAQVYQVPILLDFYCGCVLPQRGEKLLAVEPKQEQGGLAESNPFAPMRVYSRPDRIFETQQGRLIIGELKVHSRKPSYDDEVHWVMDPQLVLNAWFCHQTLGRWPTHLRVDYLIKSSRIFGKKDTRESFMDRVAGDFGPANIGDRLVVLHIPIDPERIVMQMHQLVYAAKSFELDCLALMHGCPVDTAFPQCPGACMGMYSYCEYHPICARGSLELPLDLSKFTRNPPYQEAPHDPT